MNIIIVDDDKNIRQTLSWLLIDEGHEVELCQNGREAIAVTNERTFDLMFMDLMMPGMTGLEALEPVLANLPFLKVIMISGQADLSTAVRATKLGAYDFLEKPLNPEKVLLEVKKIREQDAAKNKIDELKKLVDADYQMIGNSPQMQQLKDIINQAAPSDGRILIYGENGTGKELVARHIYQQSNRPNGPFVELNCAAIPNELLESELFGYEKGAFTGAHRKKEGLIEQAEGGTLFLDEVGDMALNTQAKLLRVLQENEFYRVGGTTPQKFNVRIVSATNKTLADEIQAGNFREDLYFRLNVIPVLVPALRDHKQDIEALSRHFLGTYSERNGKRIKRLTADAMQLLLGYHWPGNIRELKNIMERLAIMIKNEEIGRPDVESVLGVSSPVSQIKDPALASPELPLKGQVADFERKVLQQAFEKFEGNVSHMANALQTDRANLHKKLQKYGLK
jgi:two-component system, NtrC family, nitrogen regulation response regulator NtrX